VEYGTQHPLVHVHPLETFYDLVVVDESQLHW
jgi:hypothetical protein